MGCGTIKTSESDSKYVDSNINQNELLPEIIVNKKPDSEEEKKIKNKSKMILYQNLIQLMKIQKRMIQKLKINQKQLIRVLKFQKISLLIKKLIVKIIEEIQKD